MPKFKEGADRRQRVLFPSSIEEYLPKFHLAKVVLDIVSMLNLGKIKKQYSERGQHAYSPRILLSVLFYGYAIGIRSSRKLSKACEERLDFMYLCARMRPSYKSISEFRRKNLKQIRKKFKDIVVIGASLGLVKIGNIKISIDGSKIRANASSKKTKDRDGLNKLIKGIDKEIDKILEEAEEIDTREDKELGDMRGDELSDTLKKLKDRKANIRRALDELEREKRRMREKIIKGKGKGELNKNEAKKIENKKINITDHDAKYMKERNGCIRTNYNVQIAVDEKEQFIVGNNVTTEADDSEQLLPMVRKSKEALGNRITRVKADAGYHSQENLERLREEVEEYLINDSNKRKVGREEYKFDKVNFKYDRLEDVYICPNNKRLRFLKARKKRGKDMRVYKCSECEGCRYQSECTRGKYREIYRRVGEEIVEQNRAKLLSKEGKEKYQKRMGTVEPVFGNIKFNLGYRYFLLRGKERARGEFNLMCIGHNIRKISKRIKERGTSISKMLKMETGIPEMVPI